MQFGMAFFTSLANQLLQHVTSKKQYRQMISTLFQVALTLTMVYATDLDAWESTALISLALGRRAGRFNERTITVATSLASTTMADDTSTSASEFIPKAALAIAATLGGVEAGKKSSKVLAQTLAKI